MKYIMKMRFGINEFSDEYSAFYYYLKLQKVIELIDSSKMFMVKYNPENDSYYIDGIINDNLYYVIDWFQKCVDNKNSK